LDRVQHRGPDASLPDRLQAKARLAAVADTVRKWPTPLSLWQRTDGSGPRSTPVEVALVRLSGPAVLAARVPGILAEAELVLGQAIHEWLRRGRPRSPRHRTGPAPN